MPPTDKSTTMLPTSPTYKQGRLDSTAFGAVLTVMCPSIVALFLATLLPATEDVASTSAPVAVVLSAGEPCISTSRSFVAREFERWFRPLSDAARVRAFLCGAYGLSN